MDSGKGAHDACGGGRNLLRIPLAVYAYSMTMAEGLYLWDGYINADRVPDEILQSTLSLTYNTDQLLFIPLIKDNYIIIDLAERDKL